MKSIMIIGKADAGKSTTVREVCKRLKPTEVFKLNTDTEIFKNSKLEKAEIQDIFNNTFIIRVKGKLILVVAGAPTEQRIKLTILIEICIEIEIKLSFLLVSKRSVERIKGFDTLTEISTKSSLILSQTIYKIDDENYKDTQEWNERIDSIVRLINENI